MAYGEKPGTHHGYQASHYSGKLASTEPAMEKQNMTQQSFGKYETEGQWKYHTAYSPFMPDLSMSSNFMQLPQQ